MTQITELLDAKTWKLLFSDRSFKQLAYLNTLGSLIIFIFFWFILSLASSSAFHANVLIPATAFAIVYLIGGLVMLISVSFVFKKYFESDDCESH